MCELLRNLGITRQKARFVSDHLDEETRKNWKETEWPNILEQAKAVRTSLFFGDEASFAMWGSLSYSWAPRGQQPEIKTSGKRKGYKMFGVIEYFSGKLVYKGIEEKNSTAIVMPNSWKNYELKFPTLFSWFKMAHGITRAKRCENFSK